MRKLNQKGFSAMYLLLVLVILVAVGGVGWYVYKGKDDKKDTATSATKKAEKKDAPKEDLTKNWTSFSTAEGKYSLKYPSTWVKADNLEMCNPGLLLLGASAESVGKCATESFGEVSISSDEGNSLAERRLSAEYHPDLTSSPVTVADVDGFKDQGTYTIPAGSEMAFGEEGAEITQYGFFHEGRTYILRYQKSANYPDASADFETLVTNTFKFLP